MRPSFGGSSLKIVILTYMSRRPKKDLFAKHFEENKFANNQEDSKCKKFVLIASEGEISQ